MLGTFSGLCPCLKPSSNNKVQGRKKIKMFKASAPFAFSWHVQDRHRDPILECSGEFDGRGVGKRFYFTSLLSFLRHVIKYSSVHVL